MKKIILLVAIALLLVAGCAKEAEQDGQKTQIANPASVYCEQQGGTLRIETNEAGQYGICILSDKTECEEWAYYRKECPTNT